MLKILQKILKYTKKITIEFIKKSFFKMNIYIYISKYDIEKQQNK